MPSTTISIVKEFYLTIQAAMLAGVRRLQDPKQQVDLVINQYEGVLQDIKSKAGGVEGNRRFLEDQALADEKKAEDYGRAAVEAAKRAKNAKAKGDESAGTYENETRTFLELKYQRLDTAQKYRDQAEVLVPISQRMAKEVRDIEALLRDLRARRSVIEAQQVGATALRAVGQKSGVAGTNGNFSDIVQRMQDKANLQLRVAEATAELAGDSEERARKLTVDQRVEEELQKLMAG